MAPSVASVRTPKRSAMISPMPAHASRRTLLTAAALAGAGFVTACDTSSTTDPGPTKSDGEPLGEVAPDLALLLVAWERVELHRTSLGVITDRTEAARYATPAEHLMAQDEVLTGLLEAAGADLQGDQNGQVSQTPKAENAESAASGTQSPPEDAAAATTARPSLESLRRSVAQDLSEDANPAAMSALAQATTLNLPLLISIAADHANSALALGVEPSWASTEGIDPSAAADLVYTLRPLIYALEVVGAQSSGDEHDAYHEVLEEISNLADELTLRAGSEIDVAPLGYGLPTVESSRAGRRELLRTASEGAPATALLVSQTIVGDPTGIGAVTHTLAVLSQHRTDWGASAQSFPGMSLP